MNLLDLNSSRGRIIHCMVAGFDSFSAGVALARLRAIIGLLTGMISASATVERQHQGAACSILKYICLLKYIINKGLLGAIGCDKDMRIVEAWYGAAAPAIASLCDKMHAHSYAH